MPTITTTTTIPDALQRLVDENTKHEPGYNTDSIKPADEFDGWVLLAAKIRPQDREYLREHGFKLSTAYPSNKHIRLCIRRGADD